MNKFGNIFTSHILRLKFVTNNDITNYDKVLKNCDSYYKLRQLLQITTKQTSFHRKTSVVVQYLTRTSNSNGRLKHCYVKYMK